MADTNGSEAAGTAHAARVNATQFLSPDSALVRAALDLLVTHAVDGAEGAPERCGHCRMSYPCPTVQHARQVVSAGGGTPEGARVVGGTPGGVLGVVTRGATDRFGGGATDGFGGGAPDRFGGGAPDGEALGHDADHDTDRDAADEVPIVPRDPVGAV